MALITCKDCDKEISQNAVSCPKCGSPVAGNEPPITKLAIHKSKSMAVVLALILGGLGMHKFYLGQPGIGFIYLIFCWTFIPSILGVIEAILYLFHSEEKFQKSFVKG
jgi:TM2 domain-containing membrane protein YozV